MLSPGITWSTPPTTSATTSGRQSSSSMSQVSGCWDLFEGLGAHLVHGKRQGVSFSSCPLDLEIQTSTPVRVSYKTNPLNTAEVSIPRASRGAQCCRPDAGLILQLHTDIHTYTYVHIYTLTYKYIHSYIYIYICMCIYIYICMYVCRYACMHACMHVCMYVYTHPHPDLRSFFVESSPYALLPGRDREGTATQAWEVGQPAVLG